MDRGIILGIVGLCFSFASGFLGSLSASHWAIAILSIAFAAIAGWMVGNAVITAYEAGEGE